MAVKSLAFCETLRKPKVTCSACLGLPSVDWLAVKVAQKWLCGSVDARGMHCFGPVFRFPDDTMSRLA